LTRPFHPYPFNTAGAQMSHAIIRGKSGRRHEVDFEDNPVRVEIYASDETVEIVVEADSDELPQERRRFALINIPRSLFSQATAEIAKRNRLR
jgi:hypothetical protein